MTILKSKRIESIDILRGIVMVIMCLDHTRDYYQDIDAAGWPMNLDTTTPALFFTRYITHFCAPIFVFLSGLSIYLQSQRKTKKELTKFLLTRGLWLIFLEIVLNNFLWRFDIMYYRFVFQVIWAIGASMVVMAALIHLRKHLLLVLGIIIVAGHNLINTFQLDIQTNPYRIDSVLDFLWCLFHQNGGLFIDTETPHYLRVDYPMLPWLGIMILGYSFGQLYSKTFPAIKRQKYLLIIGTSMLAVFTVLKTFNLYGDPYFWFDGSLPFFKSFVSFLRIEKYPPSLHYTLVTIGVCLIMLSLLEKVKNKFSDFLLVFGRVPLFFYFLHVGVIHASSMLLMPLFDKPMYHSVSNYENLSKSISSNLGLGLLGVYIAWVLIVAALYYPCLKYMRYKKKHPEKKWLSYL
ncbi:hypothetical protein KORDIASMS9_04386 [Kordia sp. SMS9]|uniref:DUF1624 domain-containing protein n=1 Tax=Kordia sp. SMS9 TaxID=2282170 RepID=UPI000E0D40E2|nr:heparan-alpha-glucosaminide N-acetyltransferase domain-containing protein [Kordia sp. SMS9]AXG72123.1 hypothetical protein KORDIASMS9_04386 [Kordia sp. SMS9]